MATRRFFKRVKRKFKRKLRRPAKRMRFSKGRRRVVRNNRQVKFGQGLPKSAVVTHKFRDIVPLSVASGGVTGLQVICNGMFQPYVGGGGHQPMYFDQMAALYDHFTVIGSKIRWKLSPATTNANAAYVACFINDDGTITPPSISSYAEQTSGRIRQMPPLTVRPTTLTQKWSAKKYFPGSTMANFSLRGDATANPVEQSVFTMGVAITGAGTMNYTVEVEVEYIAVWTELKDLGPS